MPPCGTATDDDDYIIHDKVYSCNVIVTKLRFKVVEWFLSQPEAAILLEKGHAVLFTSKNYISNQKRRTFL